MSALAARKTDDRAERALREDIAGFRHDPLGYVRYNFPWGVKGTTLQGKRLRTWQRQRLELLGQLLRDGVGMVEAITIATASGHGIGKSALVAMILKWAFDTHEDTRGLVTANTEKQLLSKTWPELTKWHNLSLTRHWAECTATALVSLAVGHDKTWRIDAIPWSEHNTEAFAGLHNEGKRIIMIFDEASAIADKVWEVAWGVTTDANTEIIWMVFGNPTRNTGEFRHCFGKNRAHWHCQQIDSRTVEGVNLVTIQKLVDTYGENSDRVRVRVRGQFPSASSRQLISSDLVDAARGKHLDYSQYGFAPKILTCDPAWTGEDAIEIGIRQGLAFKLLKSVPKNDNDIVIAQMLARFEDKYGADAVHIDAGYGTGIKSAGDTWGRNWTLVWFSAASPDPAYANMRAYMWGKVQEWLVEGGVIEDDQELVDDLIGIETKPTLDGKILLESKEDMKKRGQPSPNKGDCLALSFAYPVTSKATREAEKRLHDMRDAAGDVGRAVTEDTRDRYSR